MNPAAIAVPVEDIQGDGRWLSMHKRFLLEAKEKEPDVLFIGDSIIQQLANSEMWNKYFVPMHALNFGIGGDQTQHVLWRIENGELEHVNPKVIVVLVGTNNFSCTAEQIFEGVMEIVKAIREKQPEAYIVLPVCIFHFILKEYPFLHLIQSLQTRAKSSKHSCYDRCSYPQRCKDSTCKMTLLPRGQQPNHLRERNSRVNGLLISEVSKLNRCETVVIDKGFIQADGSISHHDMYDYLHLTNSGYHKAFEPVYELLLQLLSEGSKEEDNLMLSE